MNEATNSLAWILQLSTITFKDRIIRLKNVGMNTDLTGASTHFSLR